MVGIRMYLVDTSVWIDFIRGKQTASVEYLCSLLKTSQTIGICPAIYQEILQGADSDKKFQQFCEYFGELPFFHPKHPIDTYSQAALLYFTCRRKGITIRSTLDCLIAQIAIEHDLILLHNDQDFIRIAEITEPLKLFSFDK